MRHLPFNCNGGGGHDIYFDPAADTQYHGAINSTDPQAWARRFAGLILRHADAVEWSGA